MDTSHSSWHWMGFSLLLVFFTSYCSFAHANNNTRVIFSVGGGAAFTSQTGQSSYVPIINPITDEFYNYVANHHEQVSGLMDGFLGMETILHPEWIMQVGLDYHQINNLQANGTFLQGADIPSMDQYAYQYAIYSRQFQAEGKLLYQYKKIFHPYVMLGLGVAFNQAHGYSTNVPPFLTFTRQYSDHTQSAFSYSIGTGMDIDATEHLRLGIGYRFADAGKVQLGSATINSIPVNGTLSQSHLYTNEVLAQLTWLI